MYGRTIGILWCILTSIEMFTMKKLKKKTNKNFVVKICKSKICIGCSYEVNEIKVKKCAKIDQLFTLWLFVYNKYLFWSYCVVVCSQENKMNICVHIVAKNFINLGHLKCHIKYEHEFWGKSWINVDTCNNINLLDNSHHNCSWR